MSTPPDEPRLAVLLAAPIVREFLETIPVEYLALHAPEINDLVLTLAQRIHALSNTVDALRALFNDGMTLKSATTYARITYTDPVNNFFDILSKIYVARAESDWDEERTHYRYRAANKRAELLHQVLPYPDHEERESAESDARAYDEALERSEYS